MFKFYDHFYVWGHIELNSLHKLEKEIEIFGHLVGCRLPIVTQITSLLYKNMKNALILEPRVQ